MITTREILHSPAFKSLVSDMEKDIFQEWSDSETPEAREVIFKDLAALNRLMETIQVKAMETLE